MIQNSFFSSFQGVVRGFMIALLLTPLAGETPWHVLTIFFDGAFGSFADLSLTLYYTTPLIFTGLAVAMALHGGLFNIGVEGQLQVGALAATACGILFPHCPVFIAPFFAAFCGIFFGALWAGIAGWLRAYRGSPEVVHTMMLNFIAAGVCQWMTFAFFRSADLKKSETAEIASQFYLPSVSFFQDSFLNMGFFISLFIAVILWIFLFYTTYGYKIRVVGYSSETAYHSGIEPSHMRFLAMLLSGGLAGCVCLSDILGHAGKFALGFSPGYGFMGITVALVGRLHPLGIVASAFLFGALHKGSVYLDMKTERITQDFNSLLQACILISVATQYLWDPAIKRWKKFFFA